MKKIIIGLGAFLSLILAAILIVPSFIDWSGYRAEIAQQVKEATGRELIIGGNIAFSLIPSPVLKVSDIHLANAAQASHEDMVSIQQLDVNVAFFPLLSGNVHVNSIRLIRPTIRLEVLKNGRGNWILQNPSQDNANIETPAQSDDPAFINTQTAKDNALPIQIDDLIIEEGYLVFSDQAQGIHEEVGNINSRFAIAALNGPFEAAGTLNVRGIPLGFESSVGQIVNDRSASFASRVTFAHGNMQATFNGSFINLSAGPKVKGKLVMKGDSLAGFISAFQKASTLPGGLDRAFSAEGEIAYTPEGINLGENGLTLNLGNDRATLLAEMRQQPKKQLNVKANFAKVDGDIWLNTAPYEVREPKPLEPVIKASKSSGASGAKVSASLSGQPEKKQDAQAQAEKPFSLPKDIEAHLALNMDAILLKGDAIRQAQINVSLNDGELALERLSAVLPGASEVSVIGAMGANNGDLQFDGSLEFSAAHLRGALEWFGLDVSHVPLERLQQFSARSAISANTQEIRLTESQAMLDGATLKGAATIALRARPSFGASFNLDRLNVDAYLANGKTPSPQAANSTSTATAENATKQAPQKASDPLAALKALDSFDANIDLSIKHAIVQKQDIRDIRLQASVFDGALTLKNANVGNFAGVALNAKGALKRKDSSYEAENLSLSLSGKSLAQAAEIAGIADSLDWQKLGPVTFKATANGNLLAPDLDINIDVLNSSALIAGSFDLLPLPKGEASVNMHITDLARVSNGLGLSYRPSGNPGVIDLSTDVAFSLAQTTLKNIVAQIGKSTVQGEALFKQGKRPYLEMALQSGQLNLTPFMPEETASTAKQGANSNRTSGGNRSTSTTTSSSSRWSKEKLDLSALNNLDAKIALHAEGILYNRINAKNVLVNATLKDGVLNLSEASGNIFGGQAKLVSQINTANGANVQADLAASGLKLGEALVQTGGEKSADGTLSLTAKVTTQGQSEFDLVSNLNGQAQMNVARAAVVNEGKNNSPLAILNLLSFLSGRDASKGLADIQVISDIDKGIANLTTATLSSSIANGQAKGTIDLPSWLINVNGALDVQQNAIVALLAQKNKIKQNYPFAITGALDQPNVKLDTGGVASGGGLVIPLPDKLEKKGVGNLIRGLLGAGSTSTDNTQPAPSTTPTDNSGTLAPPPPPPGSSGQTASPPPSVEEQLIKGLGDLLKKR